MPQAIAVSFGFLHSEPPAADLTIDVRGWVPADPHTTSWCRPLTGADPRVRDAVLAAPSADVLLDHLCGAVVALAATRPGRPAVIALGCAGGRHRSVALADALAARLRAAGVTAEARHEHITRPVVRRPA